jgi:cytochrome P450
MLSLAELDRSNVVDVDLGSFEFKQNARASLAEWAKRPPFYVLSNGPPQVVCGRYSDVHEVFSDPARFSSEVPRTRRGNEQFDKFMGVEIIAQIDGERRASAGFMPAFSSRSMTRIEARITEIIDDMLDAIERRGNASTVWRTTAHSSWSALAHCHGESSTNAARRYSLRSTTCYR